MSAESQVLLPPGIVGPSLTVAGLASWMFLHAGRDLDAERCGRLQDLIDSALHQGPSAEVWVPRVVASEAAALWEEAALVADGWGANAEPKEAPGWGRHAERLRIRAESLRRLLQQV